MTAFGIDLGTTNSCIAYVDASGHPVVLRNALGERLTPSVVYFERPHEVITGAAARNAALAAPELVARLFKRKMGDPDAEYAFHGIRQTPETISAYLLKDLAAAASRELGGPATDVVITVPAYFGVAEKEATRRAGQIAGLTVLDVIPEPVAAALSHIEAHKSDRVRHLLVYDLGGGTFDTSVIRVDGVQATVLCTGGDLRLGGTEWDARITDHLLDGFVREHPDRNPADDAAFMLDLRDHAEQIKKDLSGVQSRQHPVRFDGRITRVTLTRDHLERLTNDLLEKTLKITEETLAAAPGLRPEEIDEVVLVGGMTRMPVVAERLRERFGLEVRQHEPDLAVARGAALFARISLPGPAEEVADQLGVTTEQVELMRKRRPTGVLPRAFGVKTADESDPRLHTDPGNVRLKVFHLLHADTRLPADTGPVPAVTVIDNQPMVEVEVWESRPGPPSDELDDNVRIGRGVLRLPPRTPARTMLHITFYVSETGLLTVTAADPRTGAELKLDLTIGMDDAAVAEATGLVARTEVTS
ncbi:Hsp70 family protein [Actinocorallia longicatena]|uniref:Hsp70 family protein n=1 Tax=Actinocorallia longicatena TaxID=111803 RepID=A0ABP6Q1A9_9ACTN